MYKHSYINGYMGLLFLLYDLKNVVQPNLIHSIRITASANGADGADGANGGVAVATISQ